VAVGLAAGQLVRVPQDWDLPGAEALVARRVGMSARGKLFLNFLQSRFYPLPPWRAG
jgi:hypothetical protein